MSILRQDGDFFLFYSAQKVGYTELQNTDAAVVVCLLCSVGNNQLKGG